MHTRDVTTSKSHGMITPLQQVYGTIFNIVVGLLVGWLVFVCLSPLVFFHFFTGG